MKESDHDFLTTALSDSTKKKCNNLGFTKFRVFFSLLFIFYQSLKKKKKIKILFYIGDDPFSIEK